MAGAKLKTTEEIKLSLTREEAELLNTVCLNIGGPPTGNRGKICAISYALRSIGVNYSGNAEGSIYFK